MSQLKIKDGNSWISIPAGGIGVPSGGNTGDMLVKSSPTDYATEWDAPAYDAPTSLLSQLTTNKCDIVGGYCVKIGKLVSFWLRLTTNAAISANTTIISGLPKAYNPTSLSDDTAVIACNHTLGYDKYIYLRAGGYLLSSTSISNTTTFSISGSYICE